MTPLVEWCGPRWASIHCARCSAGECMNTSVALREVEVIDGGGGWGGAGAKCTGGRNGGR